MKRVAAGRQIATYAGAVTASAAVSITGVALTVSTLKPAWAAMQMEQEW